MIHGHNKGIQVKLGLFGYDNLNFYFFNHIGIPKKLPIFNSTGYLRNKELLMWQLEIVHNEVANRKIVSGTIFNDFGSL